ncbi:MAG: hypothetical protein K0R55_2294 [Sporomusa sp.]|jgi:hypothetical protein|nr:hypothetical protein [Sporomusa sp.]
MQNRWQKYLVRNLFYDNVPVIRISAWSPPESEDASALFVLRTVGKSTSPDMMYTLMEPM